MKKICVTIAVIISTIVLPLSSKAQDPITLIIKEAIKKAVQAADLRIQRLQNKTITLQNTQKRFETAMSKEKLSSINDWIAKQKELYQNYYNELMDVRAVVRHYEGVKRIIEMGSSLVKEYKRGAKIIGSSDLLSNAERVQITRVYRGMLDKSLHLVNSLTQLVEPGLIELTDWQRIQGITKVEDQMQQTLDDLRLFSAQNGTLIRQRSAEIASIKGLKKVYNQ
jgi:hypothetical protein